MCKSLPRSIGPARRCRREYLREMMISAAAATVGLVIVPAASAQLSQFTYSGGMYTQDFNGLPLSGSFTFAGSATVVDVGASPISATGMTGWEVAKIGGTS